MKNGLLSLPLMFVARRKIEPFCTGASTTVVVPLQLNVSSFSSAAGLNMFFSSKLKEGTFGETTVVVFSYPVFMSDAPLAVKLLPFSDCLRFSSIGAVKSPIVFPVKFETSNRTDDAPWSVS